MLCFECGKLIDDINNPLSKNEGGVCLVCALESAFYKKNFDDIIKLIRDLHIGIARLRNLVT